MEQNSTSNTPTTSAQTKENSLKANVSRKRKGGKRVPRSYTPMVRFDSTTKTLVLTRTTNVDGNQLVTPATSIPLTNVKEDVRQVAIAIAKLVITYANGSELNRPRVSKVPETGEERKLPSLLEEFITLTNRLNPKTNSSSTDNRPA